MLALEEILMQEQRLLGWYHAYSLVPSRNWKTFLGRESNIY